MPYKSYCQWSIRVSVKLDFIGRSVQKLFEMVSKVTFTLVFTLFIAHIHARNQNFHNVVWKNYSQFIERSRDTIEDPGFDWGLFFKRVALMLSKPFTDSWDSFFCFFQQFCSKRTHPDCIKSEFAKDNKKKNMYI